MTIKLVCFDINDIEIMEKIGFSACHSDAI